MGDSSSKKKNNLGHTGGDKRGRGRGAKGRKIKTHEIEGVSPTGGYKGLFLLKHQERDREGKTKKEDTGTSDGQEQKGSLKRPLPV